MEFNEAWDHACSAIGLAARIGNLRTLQKLIARGKPVDVADNRGWRPLHEAVYRNHIDCVELLLKEENTDVNWKTFRDATALHLACEQNHSDVVKLLLENGADINVKNDELRTPLMIAVVKSAKEIVAILLEHCAYINDWDMNEWTPLFFAVSNSDVGLVKLLLRHDADMRVRDEHGRNVVFLASEMTHFECLKVLIEYAVKKGVGDIINTTTVDGTNALMIAAQHGSLKSLKYLTENGGNINQITEDGCTALHLAVAGSDSTEIVNYLLEKMDLEILKQPNLRDLIHLAVAKERNNVLQVLVKANMPIEVERGIPCCIQLSMYNFLIVKQSDVKISTFTYTPLGRAVVCENEEAVQILLAAGANPNAASLSCVAPLTLLVAFLEGDEQDILMRLLKGGATVNYSKASWCKSESVILAINNNKWGILNTLITAGVDDITFFRKIVTDATTDLYVLAKPLPLIYDFLCLASQSLQWSTFLKILYYSTPESYCYSFEKLNEYKQFTVQPPSLKHFSRLKVRNLLMLSGAPSLYTVDLNCLELPELLKKYLLFDDDNIDARSIPELVRGMYPAPYFGGLVRHGQV